jgi:hypothetical protein
MKDKKKAAGAGIGLAVIGLAIAAGLGAKKAIAPPEGVPPAEPISIIPETTPGPPYNPAEVTPDPAPIIIPPGVVLPPEVKAELPSLARGLPVAPTVTPTIAATVEAEVEVIKEQFDAGLSGEEVIAAAKERQLERLDITEAEVPTYAQLADQVNLELGGRYVGGYLTPPSWWKGSVTEWSRHIQQVAIERYHALY